MKISVKMIALGILTVSFMLIVSACGSVNGTGLSSSASSSAQSNSDNGPDMGQVPSDSTSSSSSNQSAASDPVSAAQAFCSAIVQKDYNGAANMYPYSSDSIAQATAYTVEAEVYRDITGKPIFPGDPGLGQTLVTNCKTTGSPVTSMVGDIQFANVYTAWTLVDGTTYQGNIDTRNSTGQWKISSFTIK